MDLHSGEQIIFEGRPSWRSTLKFYLGGLVFAGAAGAIAGLAQDTGLGVAVGVGVFAVVLVVGFLIRFSTHYIVTDERLHIRRGLIARHVQETRLERVQNVNTNQSVLERVVAAVDRAQRAQSQQAAPSASPPPPATPPADAPSATGE
jgi:hypothetical protein